MDPIQNANTPAELLEWHKPEISRLVVSIDTKSDFGSGTDFEQQERSPA